MLTLVQGHQVKLLCNGAEYFPALAKAITQAQHEIHLHTYIYEADAQGLTIAKLLIDAAQRGVKVRVLMDGFGSRNVNPALLKDWQQAGVEWMFFRPQISPWTFQKKRLRRLHHKITVVDGHTAFVGGINIIDDYNVPHRTPPRVDYAVQLQGPLLKQIHTHVARLWRHVSWRHFKVAEQVMLPTPAVEGDLAAAFVVRDNVLHRRDIEKTYLSAIVSAQTEIIIANAYFIPGRAFRQALLEAAKRGVKVRLLLQGRMEYFLMLATHAFYTEFLRQGIEIYEYQKSFMHSKVAVIDGTWATVGSSNIDPFSLLMAREANIVVVNAAFANRLRTCVMQDIAQGAVQISAESWQHRPLLHRAVAWSVFGFVRFVMGLLGYSD